MSVNISFVGAPPIGLDNVNLSMNDVTPQMPIGQRYLDKYGNMFMYVKNADTAATASGDATVVNLALSANTNGAIQTAVPATATLNMFAGIYMDIVSAGNYGWIQIYGFNLVATNSGGVIAAGSSIKLANAAKTFISDAVAGTNPSFAAFAINTTAVGGAGAMAAGTVFIKGIFA